MKEIGSIFPLSEELILKNRINSASFPSDRIFYSLCRESFNSIAIHNSNSNKTVLIPAYTCQTVISPFEELGWNIIFYSIGRDLRIDINDLKEKANSYSPAIIVAHPYFGMDFNSNEDSALFEFSGINIKIAIDLTQCIFSSHNYKYADYIVGSYRKWFPIPDGGFLITTEKGFEQPINQNTDFTENQTYAMYLRDIYFHTHEQYMKEISVRLSKTADRISERPVEPHSMSDLAYNLLTGQDRNFNQKQRFENYRYLYDNITESLNIEKVCKNIDEVTTAPLYFTIFTTHRKDLQTELAQNSVYAPVIWPVEEDRILINDDVRHIYEHLLAIPCDQRYDTKDMQRIAMIINKFNEKK